MRRLTCQTSLGEVWLWGELTGRPVLLIVTGAFADPGTLDHAPGVFPSVDVLRSHIPGNHSPQLAASSVGVYAAALSEALGEVAPDAPLGILGLSLGGLVAMGVSAPNLRRLVVVEPPLLTADAWHLAQSAPSAPGSAEAAFLRDVFGIVGEAVTTPRDYSPLLTRLAVPTEVLIGDVPPSTGRRMAKAPSFVGPAARAMLASHRWLRTTVAPGVGHNLPAQAPQILYDALARMVGDLTRAASEAR